MITQNNFTRVNNDINGNPRYVIHFLDLLTESERKNCYSLMEQRFKALNKAKKIGGKAYRGRDYGGGIVFQAYNLQGECDRLNKMLDSSNNIV